MTNQFLPAIAGARLSVQVADQLAQGIKSGRLKPGQKLPTEAKLVDEFKVSRTVIREALSRLKSLGLVQSQQGSGVYVQTQAAFEPLLFDAKHVASREAVIQIVEVRRALEAECAELAAKHAKAHHIKAIERALLALDKAVQKGQDGVEEDVLFHRAIASAAGNPFLIGTLDYLAQFLRGCTRVTRANEARRADFAQAVKEEHHAIVSAIKAGDSTKARRAATQHMLKATSRIQDADGDFWKQEGHAFAKVLTHTA